MNKQTQSVWIIAFILLAAMTLSACDPLITAQSNFEQPSTQGIKPTESENQAVISPTITPEPVETPADASETENNQAMDLTDQSGNSPDDEDPDEEPEETLLQSVGPDNYPEGINPLTGLPVKNVDLLKLPPALISVSNFPASGRPQAGLNSSPIVIELTVGQGMTRFLVMFYGAYPELVSGQTEGDSVSSQSNDNPGAGTASIGPIRSGRLPYEDIRKIYSGFLVMASAYSAVGETLSQTTSVFGSDEDDINSAMVDVNKLAQIAQSRSETYAGQNFSLEGMLFSQTPPENGFTADQAWVFYSKLNQIQWRYDPELGAYVRYDISTDGSGEFTMATDRLTGAPLTRENVIVLFAEHDYQAPTLIDIDLRNKPPTKAILFRDGEIHEIFWTTRYGDFEKETGLLRPIRFIDAEGNPVPLKHGNTWIHLVSPASYYLESALRDAPFQPTVPEEGTGLWLVRYRGLY